MLPEQALRVWPGYSQSPPSGRHESASPPDSRTRGAHSLRPTASDEAAARGVGVVNSGQALQAHGSGVLLRLKTYRR